MIETMPTNDNHLAREERISVITCCHLDMIKLAQEFWNEERNE